MYMYDPVSPFITDMTPAPPVGFNLTFICPEGQVFEQDWFATPFIMMTCKVTSTYTIRLMYKEGFSL